MTQYGYTPLSGAREIRLLKLYAGAEGDDLSLDLVHIALDEAPRFVALSYPWGEPQPRKVIRCSGLLAEIGPNLHSALQHLREPDCDTFVWADALCINQEDIPERTQQVKMMGEIYAAASVTAIWLGDESDELKMAFGWLRRFDKVWASPRFNPLVSEDASGLVPRDSGEEMLKAAFGSCRAAALEHIWALLARPWFTRKWVIQELVKSRRPFMVAGTLSRLPWVTLVRWLNFVFLCPHASQNFVVWRPQHNALEPNTGTWGMDLRRASILTTIKAMDEQPLLYLVAMTLAFHCGDPRDHIFTLVGIASDADRFNLIDYKSPTEEVWQQLSYGCVSDSTSLKLLWSLVKSTPLKHRVCSWVPNLEGVLACGDGSVLTPQFPDQHGPNYNASGASVLQAHLENGGRTLTIRGRIADRLQLLGSDSRSLGDSNTLQNVRDGTGHVSPGDVQKVLRHQHRWLEECMEIVRTTGATDCEKAFRDALLYDILMTKDIAQAVEVAKSELFEKLRFDETLAYAVDGRSFSDAFLGQLRLSSTHLLEKIVMGKMQQRFGRTDKGRLGWFPVVAEEGDFVSIFDGMQLHYAIRSAAEGRFHLVGECIIPGVMTGEAGLESPGVDSEMIVLE